MSTVKLVGIFKNPEGGEGARLVNCHIRTSAGHSFVKSNKELDYLLFNAVRQIAALALRDAKQFNAGIPEDDLGIELQFDAVDYISRFEDVSYGLPIYAGILADLLNLPIRADICGSGAVLADGRLGDVDKLLLKADEALSHGIKWFLYPSNTHTSGCPGIPVANARTAALVWIHEKSVIDAIQNIKDPATFFWTLSDFLSGHSNELFPDKFADKIHAWYSRHPVIAKAYNDFQPEWILRSLQNIYRMPEKYFEQICQLLYPMKPFKTLWQDAILREDYLLTVLNALDQCTEQSPFETLVSVYNFFRIISSSIDLPHHFQNSTAVRESLFRIRDHAMEAGVTLGIQDRIQEALSHIGGIFRDISLVGAEVTQILPDENAYLEIGVVYDRFDLKQLVYAFPDHPEIAPIHLHYPAAFFDHSGGLPEIFQIQNWQPAHSALAQLPYGASILDRYGEKNLISFPAFKTGGLPTHIFWGDGTMTWPPSIDTLHLAGTLAKLGIIGDEASYYNVLDLGCATGVLGILIAKNAIVSFVDFLDIEPGARLTVANNLLRNFTKRKEEYYPKFLFEEKMECRFEECTFKYLDHRGEDLLARKNLYDLVICTPPYVPYLEILKNPFMWRAVAGTGLLRFVLEHHNDIGKRVIVQFSEIALPEVEDLLPQKEPVAIHAAGFRIPPVLPYFIKSANKEAREIGKAWLDKILPFLIDTEKTNKTFIKDQHHGFKYFHNIRTYLLE